jgi:hypothetical protein
VRSRASFTSAIAAIFKSMSPVGFSALAVS